MCVCVIHIYYYILIFLGTTPERRKFTFPRTLVKTEEHGVILEEFHKDYTLNEAALTPLPDTSLVSEVSIRLWLMLMHKYDAL